MGGHERFISKICFIDVIKDDRFSLVHAFLNRRQKIVFFFFRKREERGEKERKEKVRLISLCALEPRKQQMSETKVGASQPNWTPWIIYNILVILSFSR